MSARAAKAMGHRPRMGATEAAVRRILVSLPGVFVGWEFNLEETRPKRWVLTAQYTRRTDDAELLATKLEPKFLIAIPSTMQQVHAWLGAFYYGARCRDTWGNKR